MPSHPTSAQLAAYAARELPAREILRVDRHVAACAECAAALAHGASLDAAAGLLRRVRRSGPHLKYEELEAIVDARTPIDSMARSHIAECGACRAELAQMQSYSAALSATVDRREPEPSLATRLGAWLNPRAFGAATAVLALAVAMSVLWQGGLFEMSDNAAIRSAPVVVTPGPAAQDAYDRSVFDELPAISAPAHRAWQAGEFASVAKILQPLAAGGDAHAQTALGLLYAEGRGVDASPAEAERWWIAAADRNASARHNLGVLRQRTGKPAR